MSELLLSVKHAVNCCRDMQKYTHVYGPGEAEAYTLVGDRDSREKSQLRWIAHVYFLNTLCVLGIVPDLLWSLGNVNKKKTNFLTCFMGLLMWWDCPRLLRVS